MKKSLLLGLALLAVSTRTNAQTITYTLPDAAAPGMAIYTEILGPNLKGNFGSDGLNQVDIQLVDPLDAARIIVGPRITSWDGRMISAFFIIPPNATYGPIPFRVWNNAGASNVDTFYVVRPQRLSNDLPGGSLGSGGSYGSRSPRNTMVVESLHLNRGSFTISDIDPDPHTPGNQSYLPFTLLSLGDVQIDGELSVSGQGKNGIAGGGAGGARSSEVGGNGYTGGGGMRNVGGVGSGSEPMSWNGGSSLCGTPGGGGLGDRVFDDQGGGGGTGFPYGTGGIGGTWYQEGGNNPAGGFGGGSGGGEKSDPDSSFGGGGGAYATDGQSSGNSGPNGGHAYGNPLIVPFCGGSGGGGGNQFGDGYAGNGGAGGGAMHLMSQTRILINGALAANGADGEDTHGIFKGGGGGGGAGGAIALTAPLLSLSGNISVAGGKGGTAVHQAVRGGLDGGNGGVGRVRLVGFISRTGVAQDDYKGPSNAHLQIQKEDARLTGTGQPGDSVIIFTEFNGRWEYDHPLSSRIHDDGTWEVMCSASSLLSCSRISVLEQVATPDASPYVQMPKWILSPESVLSVSSMADVSIPSLQSSLSIAAFSNQEGHIRTEIAGPANTALQLQVFDMLGRSHLDANVATDARGFFVWRNEAGSLSSGTYVLVVKAQNQTCSKMFTVFR